LPELAFGAIERELQLARLDVHEHVAGADLASELHGHVANDAGDFAADLRLVGRHQGAGEIHLPLYRHALNRGRLDRHGGAAAASAAATGASAAARGRLGRSFLARRDQRHRKDQRDETATKSAHENLSYDVGASAAGACTSWRRVSATAPRRRWASFRRAPSM
jgi:hypothetical protein